MTAIRLETSGAVTDDDIVLDDVVAVSSSPVLEGAVAVVVGKTGASSAQAVSDAIDTHKADTTPHTVYDDAPSLTIIFENGLI